MERTVRLAAATPAIRAAHGAEHPLLGHSETADVVGQLWDRLTGMCREVAAVFQGVGPVVGKRADGHSIVELNRMCAERGPGGGVPGAVVPDPLLVAYGGLADDMRFLRRADAMHRTRIIAALPGARGGLDIPLPPATGLPDLAIRLTSRRIVNWRRVYAALWPQKYQAGERARAQGSDTVVHFASRIEFLPD